MNLKHLIEELSLIPQPENVAVVQSVDSEGNSIRITDGYSVGAFEQDPKWTWEGALKIEKLTPELAEKGYSEEDVGGENSTRCICFWPVN